MGDSLGGEGRIFTEALGPAVLSRGYRLFSREGYSALKIKESTGMSLTYKFRHVIESCVISAGHSPTSHWTEMNITDETRWLKRSKVQNAACCTE